MTITCILTYQNYGCVAFSDPVLAMLVFRSVLLSEKVPHLELSYTKDYKHDSVFSFDYLFNSIGWQYLNIKGNECFVRYRKDIPKKYVKEIGFHLQNQMTKYEKDNYRADKD